VHHHLLDSPGSGPAHATSAIAAVREWSLSKVPDMVQGDALVLGGGGVTGVAWETGVLAGLSEAGLDLSTAELLVGTSAGAAVAAQLASGTPLATLLELQLAGSAKEIPAKLGPALLARYFWAMLTQRDPGKFGRAMGRLALDATTVEEAERRVVIASRLPSHVWPERPLRLTAVNARTGAFRVFERDDRVPLVDAVAASCAVPGVWPPVSLGGEKWIDGGMRSAVNADLAAGRARVVILAPTTAGVGVVPSVGEQAAALRAAGSAVVVVSPDRDARSRMGRNSLDPAKRAAAAQAGHRQAARELDRVAAVWR
jgi:NTE family protein